VKRMSLRLFLLLNALSMAFFAAVELRAFVYFFPGY
jgi:hypothetical protein